MNYYDAINAIRQNLAQPNVDTKLSVHEENGTVLYGYGSLRYHEDLFSLIKSDPKLPIPLWPARPTAHFPIEGLSSSDRKSFKIVNSKEYDTNKRGSWGEYQPFPIGVDQFLSVTVFQTQNPLSFQTSLTVQIEVDYNNFELIRFDAEIVGGLLRGIGRAISEPSPNAIYVLSFGSIFGDIG